jgi:hypothetical protein
MAAEAEREALRIGEFKEFLEVDRQDRAANRKAAKAEHECRRKQAEEAAERQRALVQVKRVPPCDGASPQSVRDWIREVDLTLPYTEQTVYVAAQSAQGALRREVEHYLNLQLHRNNVPWKNLRAHLQKAFLSPHEDERLRHEVERLRQTAYETTASFGRRFREAADLAYPQEVVGGAPHRNQDQRRLLLRCYLKGLRDRCLVERLIKEGRPDDYQKAMKLVDEYEADDY